MNWANTSDPIFHAVLGYSLWTLILVWLLGGLRSHLTLTGQRRANQFAPSGEDVSAYSNRLCRAHANCFENLPVFLGVVLAAGMSGQLSFLNSLAYPFLVFRVAQSLIHLHSTRTRWVIARFFFMLLQVMILTYWVTWLFLG